MHEHSQVSAQLIVPLGTRVVLRYDVKSGSKDPLRARGTVAVIVGCPADAQHAYRVRFPDSTEVSLRRSQFSILKQVKAGPIGEPLQDAAELDRFIIYRCIVGSQAYGLNREASDIDRRGIYLPPAELEWSLYGVPEQLESAETEECYWELKKFITLALKANPNILECLYTPLVEQSSEVTDALLAKRHLFLSKLVYQTYNGYVMSQFKKLEQDVRAKGEIRWKHGMHLIRLLLQGISILQTGEVPVRVTKHRENLLAIRDGQQAWEEVNRWRLSLHRDFDQALQETSLPDVPDYAAANEFLVWARRQMVEERL